MKYQTGNYTSADNLMYTLRDLLALEGWVIDMFEPVVPEDLTKGRRLHISKAGSHFVLRSFISGYPVKYAYLTDTNGIQLLACNGFNPLLDYDLQPGTSTVSVFNKTQDLGKFHLFTADSRVLLVTEYETNVFSHVVFGLAPTLAPGTGGQFLTGTMEVNGNYETNPKLPFYTDQYSFACRVYDDWSNYLFSSFSYTNVPGYFPIQGNGGNIHTRSTNRLNGISCLMPVELFFRDADYKMRPFASFNDLFLINFDLFEPMSEYVVGENRFILIPLKRKESPFIETAPHYGLGFAVKI